MASFLPFLIGFGLQAGAGILGNIGDQQQADAAARQRNRSNLQNYRYNLQRYNEEVSYRRQIYAQRVKQYQQQVKFNNEALQDAYEGEQRRLNDVFDSVAFKNQDSLVRLAQVTGQAAAAGKTGVTARRLENANQAAFGRLQALRQASLKNAIGNLKFNNRRFRKQTLYANQQAYADVAVAPRFGPPPLRPPSINSPNRLGLSIGSTLLNAAGANVGRLPDSFFGLD